MSIMLFRRPGRCVQEDIWWGDERCEDHGA